MSLQARSYCISQWILLSATLMTTVIANSQVAAAGIRAMVLSNAAQQHGGNDPDDNWDETDSLRRNGLDKDQIFEQG